ncbi:selenocysteine insertion sequence-binding protein 2 [Pseudophryne corroboree]|uniref:selenocysteine insertion sequence-binding protein 2 n=1 Tax=Pseudophryne corroboree TaxID=495146 RepID=UPI0030820DB2
MQAGGVTPVSPQSTSNSALSWAHKVKQAPKNVIPSTTSLKVACSSPSSFRNRYVQGDDKLLPTPYIAKETEEVVEKKKRKQKKKKKSSGVPETVKSTNEIVVFQEPPKFQDDEEFPDLISSAGGSERGNSSKSNSSYTWGPREALESSKTKGSGKKSKTPVKLDLGDMLAALEQKQHTVKAKQSAKPIVLSVGGGIPVLSREPVTVTKHTQSKQGLAPHNPLDSSAPLVKKGKQREVPKAKKPTSLKKIILKEREQRKQLQSSQSQDAAQPVVEISPDNVECLAESQTLPEQSPPSPHPSDMAAEKRLESDDTITLRDHSKDIPDATEVALPIHPPSSNLPKIHSRRFREYCSQVLSKEVDTCVTDLLKELVRFQDRLYLKDPVKAKAKRRLVMGLREVLKHLKLKKLKCVIISPNCEKIQSKGGLDDTLQTIINCACEQNVPFVFALNRKSLGRCVNKAVPVSVVGIFSYDGAQGHFHKLYELTMKAREAYTDMVTSLQEQQKEDEVEGNDLENTEQKPVEVSTAYTPDDADEPNYSEYHQHPHVSHPASV